MKTCPKCNQTKETGEFGRNKARADKLTAYCRKCTKEVAKATRARRTPEQVKADALKKQLRMGTEAQKAKRLAYSRTEEAKAARRTRDQTPEGRAVQARYRNSEKGKATAEAYRQTEGFRESLERRRAFLKTPEGIAERKATTNKYRSSEKGKATAEAYKRRNLLKVRARAAVNNATRFGGFPHISTQKCVHCEAQAVEYHHYLGYEFEHWLDVIPLCQKCHSLADNPEEK